MSPTNYGQATNGIREPIPIFPNAPSLLFESISQRCGHMINPHSNPARFAGASIVDIVEGVKGNSVWGEAQECPKT